ncbi:MAG: hypothetical protein Kow0025_16580 [Thermodesulfovibrionales bacterium]
MERNVGGADRAVRVVIGLALVAVAFAAPVGRTAAFVLLAAAAVAFVTAAVGF